MPCRTVGGCCFNAFTSDSLPLSSRYSVSSTLSILAFFTWNLPRFNASTSVVPEMLLRRTTSRPCLSFMVKS